MQRRLRSERFGAPWFTMLLWALAAEVLGALGSLFTVSSIPTWYATLAKPFFSPPNWVFGPVWALLYALIGIAGYLVYRRVGVPGRTRALIAYAIQFALNMAWTPVFFGLHNPVLALAVIVALLCMIVLTIVRFLRVSRVAAYLFVPYLVWVSFATALNIAIVLLN